MCIIHLAIWLFGLSLIEGNKNGQVFWMVSVFYNVGTSFNF
jgi:hypothetical protein